MSVSPALFATGPTEWETPQPLFQRLDAEFHFTLDVCASDTNTKVMGNYFTRADEGLRQSWAPEVCWMNPPYGRLESNVWVEKAYRESREGAIVVALLPSRTDTRWWHDYVMKAQEIRFIRGRVHFVGGEAGAPFPSVIVVFKGREKFGAGEPAVSSLEK